jgi:hypothetical protein
MTNTPTFDLDQVRSDVLDAVKQGQDFTLDTIKSFADITRPVVEALPKFPLATELYEAQLDFNRRLLDVLAPSSAA